MGDKKIVFLLRKLWILMFEGNEDGIAEFDKYFTLVTEVDVQRDTSLMEKVEGVMLVDIEAWIEESHSIFHKMPKVKAIATISKGHDNLVNVIKKGCNCFVERDIAYGNIPGANAESVANFAFTLILVTARHILKGMRVAMGPEPITQFVYNDPAVDVTEQTLGIVGMGTVGQQVALRAKAFNMKVLYHNRTQKTKADEELTNATYYDSLHDMLPVCDYVLLTCPLTPTTHHLIGDKEFSLMKPSASIVNMARGGIVDTDALVKALKEGEIQGAALDVTDPEPLPRDHPLLQMKNVLITPHTGGFTVQSVVLTTGMIFENLKAVLIDGKDMPYPIIANV